jgi:hypothetical protein
MMEIAEPIIEKKNIFLESFERIFSFGGKLKTGKQRTCILGILNSKGENVFVD